MSSPLSIGAESLSSIRTPEIAAKETSGFLEVLKSPHLSFRDVQKAMLTGWSKEFIDHIIIDLRGFQE
jgi:hypothetical protein